jgi:hypothetical protein
MDEYIRADNDFCQRRRRLTGFPRLPGALEGGFILGMSSPFITPTPMMKGPAMLSIVIKILSLQT